MGSQSSKPTGFVQRLNHRDETCGGEPDACLVGARALRHPHARTGESGALSAVRVEVLGPWAPPLILELPCS